jgi:hypothetical protein
LIPEKLKSQVGKHKGVGNWKQSINTYPLLKIERIHCKIVHLLQLGFFGVTKLPAKNQRSYYI